MATSDREVDARLFRQKEKGFQSNLYRVSPVARAFTLKRKVVAYQGIILLILPVLLYLVVQARVIVLRSAPGCKRYKVPGTKYGATQVRR